VAAENYALWSSRARLDIVPLDLDRANNFGGASVSRPGEAAGFDRVAAWPLRDFIATDEHVSFIKLDVEGSEYRVLLGALEVLARCRPVMFVEWPLSDKAQLTQQIAAMSYAIEERGPNFLCLPLA